MSTPVPFHAECQGPFCDRLYHPAKHNSKYCSIRCRRDAERKKTRDARLKKLGINPAREETECAWTGCDKRFTPIRHDQKTCCPAHYERFRESIDRNLTELAGSRLFLPTKHLDVRELRSLTGMLDKLGKLQGGTLLTRVNEIARRYDTLQARHKDHLFEGVFDDALEAIDAGGTGREELAEVRSDIANALEHLSEKRNGMCIDFRNAKK